MNASAVTTLDARGLLCPQPVLLLARAARTHPGSLIEVLADDPAAATDIPAWCGMRGAELIGITAVDGGAASSYLVQTATGPTDPITDRSAD